MKKKTIKAWAIVSKTYSKGAINMPWLDYQHFVFANKKSATIALKEDFKFIVRHYKVVPCTITYSLQSKGDGI